MFGKMIGHHHLDILRPGLNRSRMTFPGGIIEINTEPHKETIAIYLECVSLITKIYIVENNLISICLCINRLT